MKYKFEEIAVNCVEKRKPTQDDQYYYIGLEHLESGNFDVPSWGSKTPLKGDKLVMKKGDVLFGKRNTYLKRVAIAPFDGLFSAHGMILRPNKSVIDDRFFPFFLASDYFMKEAIRISVGSLSPTINWKDLKKLEFNLPPIEEQARIADLLWAMNDAKKAYRKLLAATDELVKARFVEMFGDLAVGTNKYETIKLSELASKISDGVHAKPDYTQSGRPFISVVNVTKKKIDFSECKYVSEDAYQKMIQSTHPEKGDVLYTKVGTYGIPVYVDTDIEFCLYVSVCLIKPLHDIVDAKFLAIQMDMPFIKRQADSRIKGIGVPDLHLNQIKEFDIIYPPIAQQREFVYFAEQIEQIKSRIEASLIQVKTLLKSLMQQFIVETK